MSDPRLQIAIAIYMQQTEICSGRGHFLLDIDSEQRYTRPITNICSRRSGMIDAVATICIFVTDQERAKAFYTEKLGFEWRQDAPMGESRWIAVAPPGARTEVILYHLDDNWEHYRQV